MSIIEILIIILGLGFAGWGLFHQLIVGGAVTMYRELDDSASRIMVMSWVAQGAFMSFLGALSSVLVFFHGLRSDAVQTTLAMSSAALLFLAGHVFVSGYAAHLKPIRIGAVLSAGFGLLLLGSVLFY